MPDSTLDKLHARFDPEAARGMDEVFQFHFSDKGDYHLIVRDGELDVREGVHEEPSVSLSLSSETLRGVMSGEISGMSAVMSGRLKATGNVMLATKLGSLFPRRG
ncbi:SCP2 sterol-binding domain-containing protein [Halomonas getboli]|uniref:SCP2 sterol-binding domain-containing protein n=1 Tax=Halomonas getboli TaxID=2935862 RepID=UPI001FFE3735|nr:SCP2 sterol-binding domain-containing protein [Halomonas getboli]MCK2183123.1 SCP2 sterol-binding domain-containing protein [Halomonas getboli]